MFIVDDAVFSMECFNWFSERTGETVIPSDKKTRLCLISQDDLIVAHTSVLPPPVY